MDLSDKTTSGAPLTWAELSKKRAVKEKAPAQEPREQTQANEAPVSELSALKETISSEPDTENAQKEIEQEPVAADTQEPEKADEQKTVVEDKQDASQKLSEVPASSTFDPFSTDGIQYITPDQMRGKAVPLAERSKEQSPETVETHAEKIEEVKEVEKAEEMEESPVPATFVAEKEVQEVVETEKQEEVAVQQADTKESEEQLPEEKAAKPLEEPQELPEKADTAGQESENVTVSDEAEVKEEDLLQKPQEESPEKKSGMEKPEDQGKQPSEEKDAPHKGQNYDLLAQISAEDKMMNVKEEKRQFFMMIIVYVMSWMFQFDAYRKAHASFFSKLYASWRGMIAVFLACGGITALLMIYLTVSFPSFVRTYLQTAGIQVSDLKVLQFSSTQVDIENMQAKDGSFYVARATLTYTLPELVRGHIREALLQGVQVNLDNRKPYWNLSEVYKLYQSSFASKMVQIENVIIPEGVVYFTYNGDSIPIKFSVKNNYVDGVLRSEIPFKTESNTVLEANGTIFVSGGRKLNWSLDLMSARFLSPKVQEVSGTVKATSAQGVFQEVKSDITVADLYSTFSTDVNIKINQDKVSGRVMLKMTELDRDNKKATRNYAFDFSDLKVADELTTLETTKDITVTASDLVYPHFRLKNAQVVLQGRLSCVKGECTYQLSDPTDVELLGLETILGHHVYISSKPMVLRIETDKDTPLFQRDAEGNSSFHFVVPELYFDGYRNAEVSPVKLELKNLVCALSQHLTTGESLTLHVADGSVETPDYILKDISADMMDPLSIFPRGKMSIKEVKLLDKKGFLQVPFSLDLDLKAEHSKAKLVALDGQLQFDFDGTIRLASGTFRGDFRMKPIQLKDMKVPLNEIYPQFPADIRHTAGTISMIGKVDYRDATMISGPMFVLFDNVSGYYKNFGFEGLNTVLSVDSLMPFSTKPDQELFVAKLTGGLPIQNLQALFQIENPYIFLNKLSLDMGQIPLSMDTLAIPFESNNTIIYLQNKRVELSKVAEGLKLPQPLEMTGFADVMIPLYIRNQGLSVQGAEVNLRDALFIAKQDDIPEFFDGATTYKTLNSSLTLNSIPNSNQMKVQVSLEDDNIITRRKFHQTLDINLNQVLEPAAILPLPQEISIKKKMFETEP